MEILGTMLLVRNDTHYILQDSDYYGTRGLQLVVDFRAKNLDSIDNLRKKFYGFLCISKEAYIYKIDNKNIANSNENHWHMNDSDWEEIENQ